MNPERIVAALLVAAVLVAWIRLAWWQRAAAPRAATWRIAALAALQAVLAGSLYLTLFGTVAARGGGTLVIATVGAAGLVPLAANETLVAMPEARNVAGAAREPDLGTALRHHGGTRALRIVGGGLVARDRPAAATRSLRYSAPPPPQGLVGLTPPAPAAPGERFAVGARIAGGMAAALFDPAGRLVDTAKPDAAGDVALHGVARVPGQALFSLRLTGGVSAPVPLVTEAAAPARALILAAAPGPEVKYLRRWAADAGLAPNARVSVGGGVALADPGITITPATLARYDVAILDDRSWAALDGGARAALAQAVRGGMGLVVRLTGPVARGWQVLGLAIGGGSAVVPVRLAPAAPSAAALAARRGPGSRDVPGSIPAPLGEVPELTRIATAVGGVPLLRDARGVPFAAWRNAGRGRVAVLTLLDSFALVTSGNGDAYADIWSALASAVGRGRPSSPARIDPLPRVGERVAICSAPAGARVTAPDRGTVTLVPDPMADGCAGYWPGVSGWHRVSTQPFYVYAADALPQVRAAARRDATLALVADRAPTAAAAFPVERQPSWRWLLLFLAAAGAAWWLERARIGRRFR